VGGIETQVKVLSSGMWPEQKSNPCRVPAEITLCQTKYENFYKNKHTGRNVSWILSQVRI